MMQKLWAVVQREYLERVRTRWFVVATVFGPILFGSLMYLPAYMATRSGGSVDVARIRILDATGSDLGRRVATALNGGLFGDTTRTRVEGVTEATLAAAESTATRAVIAREIRGYLVLDRSVFVGKPSRYAGTNEATAATWEVPNVDEMVNELKAKGVTFEHYDLPDTKREGDVHVAGGTRVAWFKDPDGNILSIVTSRKT